MNEDKPRKLAQEETQEVELLPLTPYEVAKKLGYRNAISAYDFLWFCKYLDEAGFVICERKGDDK